MQTKINEIGSYIFECVSNDKISLFLFSLHSALSSREIDDWKRLERKNYDHLNETLLIEF